VNRGPGPEPVELVLRDGDFEGAAQITVVTDNGTRDDRVRPAVASATVTEGSEKPSGSVLSLTLPPQSFAVIETAIGR
jgi:hypothetical protein